MQAKDASRGSQGLERASRAEKLLGNESERYEKEIRNHGEEGQVGEGKGY